MFNLLLKRRVKSSDTLWIKTHIPVLYYVGVFRKHCQIDPKNTNISVYCNDVNIAWNVDKLK